MLLAELEIRHSRAIAPTRRVALGSHWLPTEPAPGYGGILLGGIVAAHLADVDLELREEYLTLVDDLEAGRRISQPRLRHRFQTDVVGLDRSRHKLTGHPGDPDLVTDVVGAATTVGACLPPYGIERPVWRQIQALAATVVTDLEEAADEETVAADARALREYLRDLV